MYGRAGALSKMLLVSRGRFMARGLGQIGWSGWCSRPLYPSGLCTRCLLAAKASAGARGSEAACFTALRVILVIGAEGPELGALFPRLSATISTSDHGPLRFW